MLFKWVGCMISNDFVMDGIKENIGDNCNNFTSHLEIHDTFQDEFFLAPESL